MSGSHDFPEAIFEATHKQLHSRVCIGEALGASCIEHTIRACIDAWNQQIGEFNEMIAKNNIDDYCRLLEDQAGNEDAQLSAAWQNNLRALLKPVDVSDPEAIKKLGPYIYIYIYIPSSIIYIYIYIYHMS